MTEDKKCNVHMIPFVAADMTKYELPVFSNIDEIRKWVIDDDGIYLIYKYAAADDHSDRNIFIYGGAPGKEIGSELAKYVGMIDDIDIYGVTVSRVPDDWIKCLIGISYLDDIECDANIIRWTDSYATASAYVDAAGIVFSGRMKYMYIYQYAVNEKRHIESKYMSIFEHYD